MDELHGRLVWTTFTILSGASMYCPILGDSSSKRLCQAWTNPWTNKRWANLFAFLSVAPLFKGSSRILL